jgi:hypothetical protein
MELTLIKLLSAHILGDFFLQPDQWVAEKENKKLKSTKLYLHVIIHIALIFLLFFDFSIWPQAVLVGAGHFIVDASKLLFQTSKTKRAWFFIDQLLHVLVIVGVWLAFNKTNEIDIKALQDERAWIYVLGALFLTSPAAIIIKVAIARFIPSKSSLSLHNAGKFIGILERLLIYVFIITQHFEAVGFLLAAKSIFRFGDLKEGNELKLTEYVLIGTLLSFGIAIITALAVVQFNQ